MALATSFRRRAKHALLIASSSHYHQPPKLQSCCSCLHFSLLSRENHSNASSTLMRSSAFIGRPLMTHRRTTTAAETNTKKKKSDEAAQQSRSAFFSTAASISFSSIPTVDVVVVGGGVVGYATANLLARQIPGLSIRIVESSAAPPVMPSSSSTEVSSSSSTRIPHPRSYALSPASLRCLHILPPRGTPTSEAATATTTSTDLWLDRWGGIYDSMQVWEAQQPAMLLWTPQDLPDGETFLGAVVEDDVLRPNLYQQLTTTGIGSLTTTTTTLSSLPSYQGGANVQIHHGSTLTQATVPSPHVNVTEPLTLTIQSKSTETSSSLHSTSSTTTTTTSTTANTHTWQLRTRLLIVADGAQSPTRQYLGIPTSGYDYGQTALTCTVQIESPALHHQGSSPRHRRAYQRFVEGGPLAWLPTFSPQHAIVVWSTTPEQAQYWKQPQQQQELIHHLNNLLQQGPDRIPPLPSPSSWLPHIWKPSSGRADDGWERLIETMHYGPALAAQERTGPFLTPPRLMAVASPILTFPLTCRYVHRYTLPRVALVGDAAHTVHPMAGQGLNLGLQDVIHLVQVIEKATVAGMDPGTFLAEYELSRQRQVSLTLSGIHALHQMFDAQQTWAKHIKSLGMNVIQNVSPLRRMLVQAACQGVAVV